MKNQEDSSASTALAALKVECYQRTQVKNETGHSASTALLL